MLNPPAPTCSAGFTTFGPKGYIVKGPYMGHEKIIKICLFEFDDFYMTSDSHSTTIL